MSPTHLNPPPPRGTLDTQYSTDPATLPTCAGTPVRLIASDIDGTILSYRLTQSGAVSARTVDAFQAARDAGVLVVLVTGRPVRSLRRVADVLGDIGPVICSNGAVRYDLEADRVLSVEAMGAEALFAAKDTILAMDPEATFAAETMDHLHLEHSFAEGSVYFDEAQRRAAGIDESQLRFGPLDDTLERDPLGAARTPQSAVGEDHISDRVVKLLAKTQAYDADAFLDQARAKLGHVVSVTHSAPGVSLLEIGAKAVNKAAELRRFAADHDIPQEQVVAFGDMPNDVEMLQWARTSWAVGSAHRLAQAAADRVTSSCDDDGVAEVIEELLAGAL